MSKNENCTVEMFKIFFRSIKIYVLNFGDFFKYMSFPVLGTVLGLAMILGITYSLSAFTQSPAGMKLAVENPFLVMLLLLICVIPGFLLFCKAFLDYIIAMVSLSRAACDLTATDKLVNNLKTYNSIIEYREMQYFFLIFILSVVYGVLSFPLLFILECVVFLYTSLAIQAFAHDDRFNAIDAIKRSFLVIPGHALQTTGLLVLLGITTYIVVPMILCFGVSALGWTKYLAAPISAIVDKLPVYMLNDILVSAKIPMELFAERVSEVFAMILLLTVVVMYLLPIRSIACTLWYDFLNSSGTGSKNNREQ